MRLFVAIELPEGVRATLARGLGELRRALPPARWVRADALHLTLKFLGEQPDTLVEPLAAALERELAPLPGVTVRLGGAGFFPRPERARVAWVGGDAPGLERWAAAVEAGAAAVGVPREPRPFALHLTLARLDRPWGNRAVETFEERVGKWSLPAFTAREAVVFRSELRPSGAVYTALRRIPAGGG